jgi:hypothetical protein
LLGKCLLLLPNSQDALALAIEPTWYPVDTGGFLQCRVRHKQEAQPDTESDEEVRRGEEEELLDAHVDSEEAAEEDEDELFGVSARKLSTWALDAFSFGMPNQEETAGGLPGEETAGGLPGVEEEDVDCVMEEAKAAQMPQAKPYELHVQDSTEKLHLPPPPYEVEKQEQEQQAQQQERQEEGEDEDVFDAAARKLSMWTSDAFSFDTEPGAAHSADPGASEAGDGKAGEEEGEGVFDAAARRMSFW